MSCNASILLVIFYHCEKIINYGRDFCLRCNFSSMAEQVLFYVIFELFNFSQIRSVYGLCFLYASFFNILSVSPRNIDARRGGGGKVDARPPPHGKSKQNFTLWGGGFLLCCHHVGAFLLRFSPYEEPFSPYGGLFGDFFSM